MPYNVLIVVPVMVNDVPTWVTDNVAPVVVFKVVPGVVVVIPVPWKDDNNLPSATVTVYPLLSNVLVAPR